MTALYTFADQTGNIPLVQLDANFTTVANNVSTANRVTVGAQPNITSVGTLTSLSSSGNITANYFIGNGAGLTGVVASNSYGNANVEAYLPSSNTIIAINSNVSNTNSNVTTLSNTVANISANITTLQGQVYGNANVASYLPTYTGELAGNNISATGNTQSGNVLTNGVVSAVGNVRGGNFNTAGNVSSTGNVIGSYLYGDGSNITNLPAGNYSNSNVVTLLSAFGSNVVSTTGNVTANFFIGDGSQLTNLPSGSNYSNANVASYLPIYTGNIGSGNIGVTGAVTAIGEITSFANVVAGPGGFFIGDGNLLANVNAATLDGAAPSITNVTNTIVLRDVSGNVEANFFIGDGSQLTNLPAGNYSNSNVEAYLPTSNTIIAINSNVANTNSNVTTLSNTVSNISANITTLQGQVYSNANVANYLPVYSGNISANNVSANFFIGDGGQLSNIALSTSIANGLSNVNIPVADDNVIITVNDGPQWTFNTGGVINLPSGSPSTGITAGQLSNQAWVAPGEGKVSLLSNDGNNSAYVNDTGITIETDTSNNAYTWNYDIFGNLTLPLGGNIYYSNGALYTTYGDSNVATYLETYTGNIAAGNISVTGNIYGNITGNVVATPTYGSFYDTTTQTNSNVGNAIPMSYNTVDINNGITIAGAGNTEITIGKTGVYNIQFSAQVNKTGGGADDIYIWLDKNGTSVPNSATALYLVGNNSKTVAAWNFVVSATAGDYYRLLWEAGSADIELLAQPAAGDVPAIPSIILTVVPVGA